MAITFVFPWIPPPTIKTIPNSPIVCANEIIKEVKKPFLDNGTITLINVSNLFAPKLSEVLRASLPIFSNDD